jgi:hypothetical protein
VFDDQPASVTVSPSPSPTARFNAPLAPVLAQLPPVATAIVGAWLAVVGVLAGVFIGVFVGVGALAIWTTNGPAVLVLPARSSAPM